MNDSSLEKTRFTAYCCGMPMKATRKGSRIHFLCATGRHGRWFIISEDPSEQSTCSCFSGEGEMETANLGTVRLYSCNKCGAKYSVFVNGIKMEIEVEGLNKDDVAKVGKDGISALWDKLHDFSNRGDSTLFHREVKVFIDKVKGDTVIGQKAQGDIIEVKGNGSIGKSGQKAETNVVKNKEKRTSRWVRPIIITVIGAVIATIVIYLMNKYGIIF